MSEIGRASTGAISGTPLNIKQCASESDTTCFTPIASTDAMQYYKNTSGAGYFKCGWTSSGFPTFTSAAMYTPTPPPAAAPIDLNMDKRLETFPTEIELK